MTRKINTTAQHPRTPHTLVILSEDAPNGERAVEEPAVRSSLPTRHPERSPRSGRSRRTCGRRAITGDIALRLAHFFVTTPEFWLNLQSLYEIGLAEQKSGKSIKALQPSNARTSREPKFDLSS